MWLNVGVSKLPSIYFLPILFISSFHTMCDFPPPTSEPSLQCFSQLSAKPRPSNHCSKYFSFWKIATCYVALPVFSLVCLPLPQHLYIAPFNCPSSHPFTDGCSSSSWNDATHKRTSGSSSYSGTLPIHCVILAQNRPSGNETTAGLRCKLSLHRAQFSRQFTSETAEQWVCNWFQPSLGGDVIKERPSVSSPSAEASLDLSKCSAPTHASPYQTTFANWTTPPWESRAAGK